MPRGERLIFAGRQTGVIKRVAFVFPNCFTVLRARIEHQEGAVAGVSGKDSEHMPLVGMIEMKVAVPGENAVEAPTELELPHVGDDPFLIGQALAAECDHGRRGIDPGDAQSAFHHMLRYGPPRAAAKVQHRGAGTKAGNEAIVPDLVVPESVLTVAVPSRGVLLVMGDDPGR